MVEEEKGRDSDRQRRRADLGIVARYYERLGSSQLFGSATACSSFSTEHCGSDCCATCIYACTADGTKKSSFCDGTSTFGTYIGLHDPFL